MLGITRGTAKKIFAGKTDKNQCTAWVNFDGTTTPPTIRDSVNVSSVVRTSAANYDIYFQTNMTNTNYIISGIADSTPSSDIILRTQEFAYHRALNKFHVNYTYLVGSDESPFVMIEVKGGN